MIKIMTKKKYESEIKKFIYHQMIAHNNAEFYEDLLNELAETCEKHMNKIIALPDRTRRHKSIAGATILDIKNILNEVYDDN